VRGEGATLRIPLNGSCTFPAGMCFAKNSRQRRDVAFDHGKSRNMLANRTSIIRWVNTRGLLRWISRRRTCRRCKPASRGLIATCPSRSSLRLPSHSCRTPWAPSPRSSICRRSTPINFGSWWNQPAAEVRIERMQLMATGVVGLRVRPHLAHAGHVRLPQKISGGRCALAPANSFQTVSRCPGTADEL
jgi:hypothetical protein